VIIIKYLSVGVLNTAIAIIAATICLNFFKIPYQISYAIGFFLGFINSMLMNNMYSFKHKKKSINVEYVFKFTFYFLMAFAVSELLLTLLVEIFHVESIFSMLISMAAYTTLSYFLFTRYVFN